MKLMHQESIKSGPKWGKPNIMHCYYYRTYAYHFSQPSKPTLHAQAQADDPRSQPTA